MGFDFGKNDTRQDAINHIIKPFEILQLPGDPRRMRTVQEYTVVKSVVYCVDIISEYDEETNGWFEHNRQISVGRVQYRKGFGWGYDTCIEAMGPFYGYDCPQKYFEIVPCPNESARTWRAHNVQSQEMIDRLKSLGDGGIVVFEEPLLFQSGATYTQFVGFKQGRKLLFHPVGLSGNVPQILNSKVVNLKNAFEHFNFRVLDGEELASRKAALAV
jgi:hypothetical protein